MWKVLRWVLIIGVCLLSLIPGIQAWADTSEGVVVSATGWIAGIPGGFTLTYVNDYEVLISWTKGQDAVNTMVRAAFGRVPENISDGYQVYYGTGTSVSDTALSLAAPDIVYYRAWSQNANNVWTELFASGDTGGFMSASFLFFGIIILAMFATGYSGFRKNILLAFIGFGLWFGLFMWLFFSTDAPFDLTENHAKILMWVFLLLSFLPLVLQIDTEIWHEAKGRRWKEFGGNPREKVSRADRYMSDFRGGVRGRRRR